METSMGRDLSWIGKVVEMVLDYGEGRETRC